MRRWSHKGQLGKTGMSNEVPTDENDSSRPSTQVCNPEVLPRRETQANQGESWKSELKLELPERASSKPRFQITNMNC